VSKEYQEYEEFKEVRVLGRSSQFLNSGSLLELLGIRSIKCDPENVGKATPKKSDWRKKTTFFLSKVR
jgi:hypothetical protein